MANSSTLEGAVVVITGASSGVGLATARAFAMRGARLVLAARQEDALACAAASCEALGAAVLAVVADVTEEAAVEALARAAVERFGRVDVWVNNAAVMLFGGLLELPSAAFDQVIQTNLFGTVYGSRSALRVFLAQRRGVLVNVASGWGLVSAPFVSAYATSKFAVVGFSESLRMELSTLPDIHVCTLSPPALDTPIYHRVGNLTGREVGPVPPVYSAERAAEAIVKLAERPRAWIHVGAADVLLRALARISPRLTARLMDRLTRATSIRKAEAPKTLGNLFEPREPHAVSGAFDVLGRRR
jgi:NAD(P)-dependent dehydrogenase (short-subunit alcohol dehydrogenase family)